jgi:Flp pilus assembly protein TadD
MILQYKNLRYCAVCLCSVLLLTVLAGCGDSVSKNTALLEQSLADANSGKWKECEESALEVLKDNPDDANALMLRSIASWHLNRRDVALASARQAAEIASESFQAQYLYGWMLAQRSESAKNAITVLNKALRLRPGDKNTLILLVQCCQKSNSSEMTNYWHQLPLAERNKPEMQTVRALHALANRQIQSAGNALIRAYKHGSKNPDVVLNLALFYDNYTRVGRSRRLSPANREKTLRLYKQYLSLTQDKPELNTSRAQVKARMKKL